MSSERKGVIVKFPLDELAAIDRARGEQDRSSWIRERLAEAVERTAPATLQREREAATIPRW